VFFAPMFLLSSGPGLGMMGARKPLRRVPRARLRPF